VHSTSSTTLILLMIAFSVPELLRSPKPIRGFELVSATWYALSVIHMRILALIQHQIAQNSTYSAQSYNLWINITTLFLRFASAEDFPPQIRNLEPSVGYL
jgi:hypothetical protein